jgi:DNA-binding NtrC family response regulator
MKILFVDDEPNILNALRRVMRSSGGSSGDWEVETTDDPEVALRMVERESVAVVVSDQRMPSMVGSDLLEAIRLKSPQTRRMILTGYADMSSAMDAINKGGAHRYLAKPWDDEILRQAIHEGVEQYRLAQENFRLKVSLEKRTKRWYS